MWFLSKLGHHQVGKWVNKYTSKVPRHIFYRILLYFLYYLVLMEDDRQRLIIYLFKFFVILLILLILAIWWSIFFIVRSLGCFLKVISWLLKKLIRAEICLNFAWIIYWIIFISILLVITFIITTNNKRKYAPHRGLTRRLNLKLLHADSKQCKKNKTR